MVYVSPSTQSSSNLAGKAPSSSTHITPPTNSGGKSRRSSTESALIATASKASPVQSPLSAATSSPTTTTTTTTKKYKRITIKIIQELDLGDAPSSHEVDVFQSPSSPSSYILVPRRDSAVTGRHSGDPARNDEEELPRASTTTAYDTPPVQLQHQQESIHCDTSKACIGEHTLPQPSLRTQSLDRPPKYDDSGKADRFQELRNLSRARLGLLPHRSSSVAKADVASRLLPSVKEASTKQPQRISPMRVIAEEAMLRASSSSV